ncbi:unnamed protein product [Ilex paraguariensis]|uniref:RING-type E3 ubiquitin transferase n=1 Tax=Ilex paraguariensis TaxID=185542 RepID=A0ABC8QRH8_9AQUA
MGQRNMVYANQIIDLEMDQQGNGHLHPEPGVLYGSIANVLPPNIHMVLPAPANTINWDVHRLPAHRDSALFYGMPQYNNVQHHQPAANLDLAVATASNHYAPHMDPPSGTRVFPIPLNHGSHDQFPFSSNHGIIGVSADSYGRNSHFVDGLRGSFKRKNAEGIPGNFQFRNASAGSSSAVAPMNARPLESDVTLMDAASFALPEYGENDMSSAIEVGSHRSLRNRSVATGLDSVMAHTTNHIIQGNYQGQPFQTAHTPWVDPQFGRNGGDSGTFTWSQAPTLPYLHGCMEAGNMNVHGYQVTASHRSSTRFLHPPPIPQGHRNLHHLPPPMHRLRGHNIDSNSQVATSSRRLSTITTSHTSVNPFQDGVEAGPGIVGSVPPTGFRIYQPHRMEAMPEANSRLRIHPHLRILPEDGVAMLEIPGYYEVGDFIDHHRDMRLDIDHMSYEELLALGERIGTVGTGLVEETITSYLKTRTFSSSKTCSKQEQAAHGDQEIDFCVICQANFMDRERIGTLDCGHEYHLDCIKRWLHVKNTCPICKSSAVTTERKH